MNPANQPTVQFKVSNFGQTNQFLWKEDKSLLNPEIGDSSFAINDETLYALYAFIQMLFAPSEQSFLLENLSIPTIKRLTDNITLSSPNSLQPDLPTISFQAVGGSTTT